MACKIDIRKAFDTLRWDFLLNVLQVSGYDDRFINWIKIILHSARLSILYNGKLRGYFGCSRGVRKGDPLSPILFGIAEDILSALFRDCVASGHLVPMSMTRHHMFPTHLFYADDILVFCKASVRNAKAIMKILDYYSWISGQGSALFTYLGVPIFHGHVRASYFRLIHDRILAKFSRWHGRLLSMAGRLCLVKSVIQSCITHSMMVYKWPKFLIKELDGRCRNFIWTGDVRKKPTCFVSWSRVCAIKEEGGLRARFGYSALRDRYLDIFGQVKSYSASSSVWLGLREEVGDLVENSYSYIGDGAATNFWKDDWLGYRIIDHCKVPYYIVDSLEYSVADYFYDGVWHFTQDFINHYPEVVGDIFVLPIGFDSDTRYWRPSLHGTVTAALTYANHCSRFPRVAFKEMECNFNLGHMDNSWTDYTILRALGVATRAAPPPDFIFVHWWPPASSWIKVNTDGFAMGALGNIAAGGVFRDHFSWVRGSFHYKDGVGFTFVAELLAVIKAIMIAHDRGWHHLWIESDSTYIVHLLMERSCSVPWRFIVLWNKVLSLLSEFQLHISHIYRKGNKAADIMANYSRDKGKLTVQDKEWRSQLAALFERAAQRSASHEGAAQSSPSHEKAAQSSPPYERAAQHQRSLEKAAQTSTPEDAGASEEFPTTF
ncbi:uncharacterized protein LOC131026015 [Salvia miltiorrhiza]|uniref:uncharacterized protein LOC131026015 n=1 Tax=Salvia miltiorrhiza TaxID=226208 RepID=UPI0025AD0B26|nr:uncharacterized protein LOC131026015 [Salvia miltiorrhiza]